MIGFLALGGAAVATFLAGRQALWKGLTVLFGVGYVYGILRANVPGTAAYLTFDAAVLGLYASQPFAPVSRLERNRQRDVTFWTTLLVGWPILLFALFALAPENHPLIELVGLRANIFLLPFLLIGARLSTDETDRLAAALACLNIGAVAFGVLQFFVGIEPFFPQNEVTEIIYKSRDVAGWTAHRIPSSFSSAHAFAGTMAMSVPLLFGAWVQPHARPRTHHILSLALVASLFGVFMAAARQHIILVSVLGLAVTFSKELRGRQRFRWIAGVAIVAYLVAGDVRLQRFTTLSDRDAVSVRVHGSVNDEFWELMGRYPLGNGLAGGGTSIPYFLRDRARPSIGLENEYARIMLEQGIPGLLLWLGFVGWIVMSFPGRRVGWASARRLAWIACCLSFAAGMIGTGMLTSVPQTTIMLLLAGWVGVARRGEPVHEEIAGHQPARQVAVARARARTSVPTEDSLAS